MRDPSYLLACSVSRMTRALIIVATGDDALCELASIKSAFKYEGIEVDTIDMRRGVCTSDSLRKRVARKKVSWSYVYVCGHGDGQTFGDDNLGLTVFWWDLSFWICDKLEPSATFLAACCRGGFNQVAYEIFAGCDRVDAVIGPRFNAYSGDLRAGFIAYLHHVESRRNDPTTAALAAGAASGIDFVLFDRLETTVSPAYLTWLSNAVAPSP